MTTPGPFRLALAARLREIESLLGGQARVCEVAGVARSTWARWIASESDPGFEALSRLATEANVSLDWLATGQGDRTRAERPVFGTDAGVDEALVGQVADGVARVYREEGARLSPADLGRMSGRLLNDLLNTYTEMPDREVGLRVLLTRLRQDLRRPVDGQTRKSSA